MDVVNGKIVSARTERSRSDIWRALKPSRGVLQPEGPCPPGKPPGSLWGAHWGAAAFDQPGWTRSWSSPSWGRNPHPKWSPPPTEFVSRAILDKELDMCESRVSRAVIDRIASPRSVGKAAMSTSTAAVAAVAPEAPLRPGASAVNPLKRPHSGIDQVAGPWQAPLRYLLCKVMSVSDVGELGRIILPKKDAEGQLPHIDTKGKQLEMKDYRCSRSWFFHYKWWVNNKSRMYVLENTGEFIKYHGLEANDSFFVYEDGCGNLVARGQKKLTWSPQLDPPTNPKVKNSKSQNVPASAGDEPC